jgi:hypothetical protein
MWVTRDGHRLGILVPRLHALGQRTGLSPDVLAGELGRAVRGARYAGTLRRPGPRIHHPVFAARSHPWARHLITRPVPHGPWRRSLPWWSHGPHWPWGYGYWPDYAVIGVDPIEVPIVAEPPMVEPPVVAVDPRGETDDDLFEAWLSDLDLDAPLTRSNIR